MIERTIREAYPQVFATLLKRWEDFELVEDCVQEASSKALSEWREHGVPEFATAWLTQVAQRTAIDLYRKNQRWDKLAPLLAHEMALQQSTQEAEKHLAQHEFANDDLLRLIFTCCHPKIALENRVALSLRLLIGLSIEEIAKALLQKPKTIEQRITRAKQKISALKLPYEVPRESDLTERTASVLAVIYLIFNEGYCSNNADHPLRTELCDQAIYLCRSLVALVPKHAEALGLLALMFGHRAREKARLSAKGSWVRLEEQDRTLWDQNKIREADTFLTIALSLQQPGKYQIQAAITALHNQASQFSETDWKQIVLLYNLHLEIFPSAVVKINQIVALWYATRDAPGALNELHTLYSAHKELREYPAYHVAEAHLLEAINENKKARSAYELALTHTKNSADKKVLIKKINAL